MPEEYEDEPEGLERPPPFFPYKPDETVRPGGNTGEPIEVSIEGVFAAESNGSIQRFVLLSDGDRKLPILIGLAEAAAISLPLEGATPDRPMTHDLVKTILERLGATVERIVIDDLWSTTYYAKIVLRHDGIETIIDSRPSDAIAIALRFESPVFVVENILHQAGDQ